MDFVFGVNLMPIRYIFAISMLISASMSLAETDQKSVPTTSNEKSGAAQPAAFPVIVSSEPPMFKLGGFATLGIAHSNLKSGDYVIDSAMPKGVGRSNEWTESNNTRIAAHVTGSFTPQISGIFQVDSEYRSNGTYEPEVEWLNVKYAFTPNVYMRVGRIALPTFIDSENHDVGYSYVWVNPPVDLYHQLSISSSDGLDILYRSEIGEGSNSLKAIYGTSTHERPSSVSTSRDLWGIFDTFEYGQAAFHFSYQERRESTKNLVTGVSGHWTKNSDLSLGGSYDSGEWFVISEWIQRKSTTKIAAMYISGGYRVDKFTPYLLYSQNSSGSFLTNTPAPSAAAIERAKRAQRTTSVGLRWDFMRNTDFKIQYDRVTLSADSNGYLVNVQQGVILHGSSFYVMTAVVDFVF